MLIYFLFASFCVAVADPKIFGLFELSKMLRGFVMFLAAAFYLRTERELKIFLYALGTIVCYEGLSALTERYYWGIHRVYGTIDDSNSLSMYLCTTAPVFVAVITSKCSAYLKALGAAAIGLSFIGVILTISRAGLIGDADHAVRPPRWPPFLIESHCKKAVMTLLVLLAMGGALAKAWKTIGARFAGDSLKNEYSGTKHEQNRGYYIRIATAIAQDSWFGVGPNNWSYWVSNKYGPRLGWYFIPYLDTDQMPGQKVPPGRNIDDPQAAPAHSLPALTVGEMGCGRADIAGAFVAALAVPRRDFSLAAHAGSHAPHCGRDFFWNVRNTFSKHDGVGVSPDADLFHVSHPARRARQPGLHPEMRAARPQRGGA